MDRHAETAPALRPVSPPATAARRPGIARRWLAIAVDVAAAGTLASLALGRLWCWYGHPWSQWPWAAVPGIAAAAILARHLRAPHALARCGAGLLAVIGAVDTVRWYAAWAAGEFAAAVPLPLSLLILLVPGLWACLATNAGASAAAAGPSWRRWRTWAVGAGLAFLVVLLHVELTAVIDHRRHADAIIVPGAKVENDGEASPALADRVRTGCALWRDGYAPTLVLSGALTPGRPVSEPQAMRTLALTLGVPANAIVCDEQGWTTAATIRDTAALAKARGWANVLVVSHGYHLARIQVLAADQGLTVATVPAQEAQSHWHGLTVLREVGAWVAAWAGLDDLRHRQTGGD